MSSDSESSQDYSDILKGELLKGKYLLVHKIGSGAFSTVWLALDINTRSYYAIKVQNSDDFDEGLDEIMRMNSFKKSNCKYINNLIENFVWEIEDDEYVCMVFELMA